MFECIPLASCYEDGESGHDSFLLHQVNPDCFLIKGSRSNDKVAHPRRIWGGAKACLEVRTGEDEEMRRWRNRGERTMVRRCVGKMEAVWWGDEEEIESWWGEGGQMVGRGRYGVGW